jgi:hypothetical protein
MRSGRGIGFLHGLRQGRCSKIATATPEGVAVFTTGYANGGSSCVALQEQTPDNGTCYINRFIAHPGLGLDHGIGHFMIFEVDLEAQAPAPPIPKWLRTSSAASDRRTVLPLSTRQAG